MIFLMYRSVGMNAMKLGPVVCGVSIHFFTYLKWQCMQDYSFYFFFKLKSLLFFYGKNGFENGTM